MRTTMCLSYRAGEKLRRLAGGLLLARKFQSHGQCFLHHRSAILLQRFQAVHGSHCLKLRLVRKTRTGQYRMHVATSRAPHRTQLGSSADYDSQHFHRLAPAICQDAAQPQCRRSAPVCDRTPNPWESPCREDFDINAAAAAFVQENIDRFLDAGKGLFKVAAERSACDLTRRTGSTSRRCSNDTRALNRFLCVANPFIFTTSMCHLASNTIKRSSSIQVLPTFRISPRCNAIVASAGSGKSMFMPTSLT